MWLQGFTYLQIYMGYKNERFLDIFWRVIKLKENKKYH